MAKRQNRRPSIETHVDPLPCRDFAQITSKHYCRRGSGKSVIGALRNAQAEPGHDEGRVSRLKAKNCLGSSLKSLEQPVDVVEFDFRAVALAGAPTQFVQDLARLLQRVLIGNFNVALIISAVI